jgi:ribonucleotide reductase alpha subunit
LNRDIFETIYYHALKASAELAAKEGPMKHIKGALSARFLPLYKYLSLITDAV